MQNLDPNTHQDRLGALTTFLNKLIVDLETGNTDKALKKIKAQLRVCERAGGT